MPPDFSIPSIGAFALGALVASVLGYLWGRAGRGKLAEERERLRREMEATEARLAEQSRSTAKMRRELDTVASLARTLPNLVRDLNRDDLDPVDVPKMVLDLAQAIFEPEQVLLYSWQKSGTRPDQRVLRLAAQKGLRDIPASLGSVHPGQGKIGWVAGHELDMIEEDWGNLSRRERCDVSNNHPSLEADIIGPLLYHANNRQQVLGVLCIGKPHIRPRDEKLTFQMVTNFGSLAMSNAWNLKILRSAAHHDGLTGLLNKRHFLEEVATKSFVKCEKSGKPLSIFIFDIDHFKTYNDTNGHPAGDELLRSMGRMLKRAARPDDHVARYGGEEFVIAMPDTDKEAALRLAEAVRQTIEDEPFPHREKQPAGKVSISGGIATFPGDGAGVLELIQRADEALYKSKKAGRNRVTAYLGVVIGDSGIDTAPVAEHEVPAGAAADLR
jgi:diguanylate cyclase (GGDEF)-like protein